MGSYGGNSHRAPITTIKTCRKLAARNPRQITTINAISSHQKPTIAITKTTATHHPYLNHYGQSA